MKLREMFEQLRDLLEDLRSLVKEGQKANKGFMSLKTAAQYSDLSVESIRRLCDSGKLTKLRPVKGKIVVDRKELDAYIRSCSGTPRTGRGRHNSR